MSTDIAAERHERLTDALGKLQDDEHIIRLEFGVWFEGKHYLVEVRRDESKNG